MAGFLVYMTPAAFIVTWELAKYFFGDKLMIKVLEFPINVFVDLEKMKLVKRYNNNSEFDSDVYFGESKDKMYMILGNLEFDELVSVPDYVREEIGKDDALDMTNDRSLSL